MRAWLVALSGVLAAACGGPDDAPQQRTAADSGGHVVVYAAAASPAELDRHAARFTAETGIRASVRRKPSGEIVDHVIADRGTPPADVVIAPDVAGAWRAADQGALRPLPDAALAAVPDYLQDPDGYWAAVDVRIATIVYDRDRFEADALSGYRDLAGTRFAGKLCLSSSRIPSNRAVIAMLIDRLGVRPAEVVVRGWVANLALPPFETEAALIEALGAGTCAAGLVTLEPGYEPASDLARHVPSPAHGDVRAIGVARHARNPDAAVRFVEWYLAEIAAGLDAPAISGRNVGIAGFRAEEAELLAERAGYR